MVGTVHRAARSRSAPPPTPPSASAAASPAPPTQPRLRRSRCPPGRTRGTPRAPRIPHRSPSPCPPCWRPARGRTGPDPAPRHDARCIHSGRPRSSLRSGSDWSTLRALIIHWTTSGVSSSAMDPTGYGGRSRRRGIPWPMPQPGDPYANAFRVEADRCWRMVHDVRLQAEHCPEPPSWTGRWFSPRGDRWWRVWSCEIPHGRPDGAAEVWDDAMTRTKGTAVRGNWGRA